MEDNNVELVQLISGWIIRLWEVDQRCRELKDVVDELGNKVEDMKTELRREEAKPGKKCKREVDDYLRQTQDYRESAHLVMNGCQEGQWKVRRMTWIRTIENLLKKGRDYIERGNKLTEKGLACDGVARRGNPLVPAEDEYQGPTFRRVLGSAVRALRDGSAPCIGIYGQAWAGKTNLMKHLYNQAFDDEENFGAVYWATAPEEPPIDQREYHKALQKRVAEGMWLDLDDGGVHDEVRCAGHITNRLQEIGHGRVVVFLDGVQRDFQPYEVLGMPSIVTPSSTTFATTANVIAAAGGPSVKCILVFSTRSREVCNRMGCDLPLKMDLLEEGEARDLFLVQAGIGENNNNNDDDDNADRALLLSRQREQQIRETASEVANQCARMPLAIMIIARSMAQINDLHEWNNRKNELLGEIRTTIHTEDYRQILSTLRFAYDNLKDTTVRSCFLGAARVLGNDRRLPKEEIIQEWVNTNLIGMDRSVELTYDQGHTILNRLERVCLLQVVPGPGHDDESVTMNKWIRKMALDMELPVPI